MIEHIIIAGAGGQGIMVLGRVLAEAAMKENKHVTWLPSYGAEVRGGTANCMVVISDEEVGSPYIDKADSMIIMNEPSLLRFSSRIKNNGLLIINSSLAKSQPDIKACVLRYPFTDIALKVGNIKVANIVALGCFIAKTKLIDLETVRQVIDDFAPKDKRELAAVNKKALKAGKELIEEQGDPSAYLAP
jgi:2-oxoglutarate ferredoxin oxidoreductase subunit gamma